ncbi:MAG: cell division protein ZapA [Oscillibacter sp.]
MENRMVVNICGEDYTLVAEESSSYMQRVGAHVDEKLAEVLNTAKVGRTDAAVLTALNITDELFKAQIAGEQLRGQIKGYLDEAAKAQNEVSELKREVFRLQQKLDSRPNHNSNNPPNHGGNR